MISLPIDEHLSRILKAFEEHSSVIITATPGSGKTTRIPPALLKLVPSPKKVLVLEPRRVAATAAAKRIAEENQWELGNEVGYQVRFEKRATSSTRLLFQTEGLFARYLANGQWMDSVGAVVLDEFHERHLWTDLALGMLREYQDLQYPNLKVVLMSATMDPNPLMSYLKAPTHVDVVGRLHPVTIKNATKSQIVSSSPALTERISEMVKQAVLESEGDVLVFLPGKGEISYLRGALEDWLQNKQVALQVLHGSLSLHEQKEVLGNNVQRRVVLSTNVSESSVTVSGVRVVVDSGLERVSEIHPKTGLPMLSLKRISLASAKQRSGRAGREGPGIVYQAWSKWEERGFPQQLLPELLRSDLNEVLLILASLGVTEPNRFAWLEAPKEGVIRSSVNFLKLAGALYRDGTLSVLGERVLRLPLGVRAGLFLEAAHALDPHSLWPLEVALLLENLNGGSAYSYVGEENDLLGMVHESRARLGHKGKEELRQLQKLFSLEQATTTAPGSIPWSTIGIAALLKAYPDRLCRRRQPHQPQAVMAGGRGVRLSDDSSVRASEYFLALEVREGRDPSESVVTVAIECPETLINQQLLPQAQESTSVNWSESDGRFWLETDLVWNEIPLGQRKRIPAPADQVDLGPILYQKFSQLRQRNSGLDQWLKRFDHWTRSAGGKGTSFSQEGILQALSLASYGCTSLEALWEKNFIPFFEQQLEAEVLAQLNRDCPFHWKLNSGRTLPILYSQEQGPFVEARIQWVLGETRPPLVAGESLTVVLLAPNHRPIQITRDLAGFWTSSYPGIRKELRGRYPKHAWPENPLAKPDTKKDP